MEQLEMFAPRAPQKPSAADIVRSTLAAALPPGSPMVFASIDMAAFAGRGTIIAHLTMFDGKPAVARFRAWAFGWSTGWDELPGGSASLEGGAWRRVIDA